MHKGLTKTLCRHSAGWIMGLFLAGAVQAEDPMQQQSIEQQIAPIGTVKVAGESSADSNGSDSGGGSKAARSGSEIYNNFCIACHGSGVAGAPKEGEKSAWAPRAEKGMDTLLNHATNGFNAMPPKGTCADCSEDELKSAIQFMLSESGIEVAGGGEAAAAPAPKAEESKAAASGNSGGEVDMAKGKQIYQSKCFACHGTGAAGAPIVGKADAWAPRIAKGMDTLLNHALNGFNAMPPKGTCMDCSEGDIKSAIAYMVDQSK